jgi:hypothetical protein
MRLFRDVRVLFFLFLYANQLLFASYNDLEQFPIEKKQVSRINTYLLPPDKPIKDCMDVLFLGSRITQDGERFIKAGFLPLFIQPRSFIIVARHKVLPGYLVKLQLDTELRLKSNKPHWEWFIRRCEGAERIQHIIDAHQIEHFIVAKKWIYPLPLEPASEYDQKLILVLVEDMQLVSKKDNLLAWKTQITKEHLDELYFLFSEAYATSFRADNIVYTKAGKFAFIDTEYWSKESKSKYASIRKCLNPEMQAYWDILTRKLLQ